MRKCNLFEIEKTWQKEPSDQIVLKALNMDLAEYSPDVQRIIIKEAHKRGLIDSKGSPIDTSPDTEVTGLEDFTDTEEMQTEEITYPCKEADDALKFAIIGLFIIGIILEPIAISKALKAKKMINSGPCLTGSGKANAAVVIAIIYLLIIITLFLVIFINNATVSVR